MTCCWPDCTHGAEHLLLTGMRPWQLCGAHLADALRYRPGSKVIPYRGAA